MSIIELLLIAVGLSMDAFAVSVCTGLSMKQVRVRDAAIVGLYFGGFQAAMPLIGYFLGISFADLITAYDHWIAFGLLAIIGGKMLWEGLHPNEEEKGPASLGPRRMVPLAVATSIDALAVGVTFAFLQVSIAPAVTFIGVTTLLISAAGVAIGKAFGAKLQSKAELFGGAILVLIGLKILLEHLGVL